MKDKKIFRRQSTNEKLAEFLNKTEIVDEEAEALDQDYKRARNRIRVTSLYGAGARFKTPKTKKKKQTTASPYELYGTFEPSENKFEESSSVAPGAHEDQFRRMRYPTEKSMNDPDRVFYTTTSMTEGIRFHPQPPWYYGYQNKTKPTDTSPVMSAARYGYRGSRDIAQYHTEPVVSAEYTKNEHTPDFLACTQAVDDEWAPPIHGSPLNKGYALTSPKLWPENTEYVTGYRKGSAPSSPLYVRETTVAATQRPYTSPSVAKVKLNTTAEFSLLRQNSKLESRGLLESRPMTQQSLFSSTWKDKLSKNANATLRQTMRKEPPPYEAHTLMDPTDTMRYSGGTAMIVHSSSSEELKFKMHMEMYRTTIPFELRWRQVISLFRTMKSRLKRDQSTDQVILEFAETLRKEAFSHGQKAALLRAQFIKAMSSTEIFEHLLPKQMSLLFSVFDPLKKSIILFVDVIAAFTVLDHPQKYRDDNTALIIDLWRLYDYYGDDMQPVVVAESVLTTCCGSDEDHKEIKRLFKDVFRPALYRLAIKHDPIYQTPQARIEAEKQLHASNSAPLLSPNSGKATNSRPPMKSNPLNDVVKNKKKHLVVRPVYNIYDAQFDLNMFSRLLEECPEVVEAFNRQLTQRLIQCYGKDPRDASEEVADQTTTTDKDFSWILKGKKR
mmetsp:Transcript_21521/g.31264  ORF Transcript_21521/g.31264 Transcript_21521/m.31264 type:complete len:668 (-) Transcript_21521:206-2209(-)|eukprot:CAMPEP_0185029316 /NCGR_PEP_ID=MMETSP1103-20130426/15541_1 /TAXON_ID=36769 /ORGANISM="Paraphysomonas bandaiensis, Strain Caron Lab Isolate" /LENGTH=667 /DNA_ID=CAMNT_0027564007 /DNA_START=199 /DNA_END=2202 /DNA_ORIENTATION=+